MLKRVAMAMLAALVVGAAASAQTSSSTPAGSAGQSSAQTPAAPAAQQPVRTILRRAISVPQRRPSWATRVSGSCRPAEVLPAKRWSASAYRVNFDYHQGFTDVSNWPVTFGFGIKDRVEIFGAWTVIRRIDRDSRPIFRPTNPESAAWSTTIPFVSQGWSDNQLGDLWIGGKVNLMSQWTAAADGACPARHDQAADRKRRRRRRRNRQD